LFHTFSGSQFPVPIVKSVWRNKKYILSLMRDKSKQFLQAPCPRGADAPERYFHSLRDLRIGYFFAIEVQHHQKPPAPIVDLGKCLFDLIFTFEPYQHLVGERGRVGDLKRWIVLVVIDRTGSAPRFPCNEMYGLMFCCRDEPGP